MRFLVDMNLPAGLADWLRAEGHDAIHVRDAGYASSSDPEILTQAAADRRIVISFDLDFGEIAALARQTRAGVVLLRLRRARQVYVRERLGVAIAEAGEAMISGAIVLVEDSRIRIRQLPPAGE